jgi:hypothetical protein
VKELSDKIDPPAHTFAVAFILCIAVVGFLHLLEYLLLSTPTYVRVGLPSWFWIRHGDYTRFRVDSFAIDLCVALFFSFRIARWYWLHRWRQLNAPKRTYVA